MRLYTARQSLNYTESVLVPRVNSRSLVGLPFPYLYSSVYFYNNTLSHHMRLWYFSSSVKLFFKHSGARCLSFGRTLRLLPYFMCAPEPSLVAYMVSTIISWAGSIVFLQNCLRFIPLFRMITTTRSVIIPKWKLTFFLRKIYNELSKHTTNYI